MLIGHFGVAFGAKAIARGTSLGTLLLAAQLIDLIWPTLALLGIEHVRIAPGITRVTPLDFEQYPISHSLLTVIGWAVLTALTYWLLRHYRRGAIVIGFLVLSHWLLDAIVHRPDLPLYPGSEYVVGLGLWNSVVGTVVVELAIFGVGVWLYLRSTVAIDSIGDWALGALLAFLLVIYIGSVFGPPPASTTVLLWVGQAQWLLVAWAYWIGRHRRALT